MQKLQISTNVRFAPEAVILRSFSGLHVVRSKSTLTRNWGAPWLTTRVASFANACRDRTRAMLGCFSKVCCIRSSSASLSSFRATS
jgi:hypothetical protein